MPTASGMLAGDGVDAVDEARGAQKRVFAQPHGRGAGVGVLAGDGDLVPAHALHALDDADHAVFGFEDRALLDVQLEQGGELVRAGFLFAAIADAPELVAEGFAVAVGAGVGVVGGEHAGEHAGGEHGRGEARAFLVGPVDDLDGCVGLVAGAMQGAQRFERGKDAERAVELAAGRLGVEVRAHGDRGQGGVFGAVLARPAREHVADLVDRDRAAERLALRLEPVAHLAVEIGQREAADAALWGGADLRGLHQVVPQTLGIDLQVLRGHGCHDLGGRFPEIEIDTRAANAALLPSPLRGGLGWGSGGMRIPRRWRIPHDPQP